MDKTKFIFGLLIEIFIGSLIDLIKTIILVNIILLIISLIIVIYLLINE